MAEAWSFWTKIQTYRQARPIRCLHAVMSLLRIDDPVPQVASINTPDAKTIIIQPWDKDDSRH